MADQADLAQRDQEQLMQTALANHRARGNANAGRHACMECGEPISTLRRTLGAVRCVDCQHAREVHEQRFARSARAAY